MVPPSMIFLLVFISGFILTWLVTHRVIALDIPNERSLHQKVIPRGGGIGIVIPFLVAVPVLEGLSPNKVLALVGGGGIVAFVGYLDDLYGVSAPKRLAIHMLASGFILVCLGGMPSFPFGRADIYWGWVGHFVGFVGIVWMINLFNFMDGIDGLAGTEALQCAFLGGVLVTEVRCLGWTLAGACLGFLFWNKPPAKVFMGDVSSGFLGAVLAILLLISAKEEPMHLWIWLILLGVFVVDATLTLVTRMRLGYRWHQAHRSHAYQHAAEQYQSHAKVTGAIALINLFWLFPLAYLAQRNPATGLLLMAIGYAPLLILASHFHAGNIHYTNR